MFSGLMQDTTEHPLSFHSVAHIVLPPTELASISTVLLGPKIFWERPAHSCALSFYRIWPNQQWLRSRTYALVRQCGKLRCYT